MGCFQACPEGSRSSARSSALQHQCRCAAPPGQLSCSFHPSKGWRAADALGSQLSVTLQGLICCFFPRELDACCRKILNKYLAEMPWVSWSSPASTVTQTPSRVSAAPLSLVMLFSQCPMNAFETHPQRNSDTESPLRQHWRTIYQFFSLSLGMAQALAKLFIGLGFHSAAPSAHSCNGRPWPVSPLAWTKQGCV